jgi:1,4-dihydroxy-2-naphthoate octaprenyltransferase
MSASAKSVIICDMEGVIEKMNDAAEQIFGYDKEELIGKKRVSIFSPGEIVLQNVGGWLKTAQEEGEYVGKTYFVRKDGSKINAKIRITPTFANGKDQGQTGYCGVTEVIDEEVEVPIKFTTKMIKALAITRMPFLSAVIMPAFVAAGFVFSYVLPEMGLHFNWSYFSLALLGVIFLHLGSNVMNDYFDVKDGTDEANNNYFQQYSGGSRAIELGLITLKGTRNLGLTLLGIGVVIGIFLVLQTGLTTLWIGLAGLFLGYFYTAPPLRYVAWRGIGELGISLAFGPLITLGMEYVLTGQSSLMGFLIGFPVGLLTANILLINEFPDADSDATTGKNHLVVTFGKKNSAYIYLFILLLSFGINLYLFSAIQPANWAFLGVAVLSLVWGLNIFTHIRKKFNSRELVKSNIATIGLSAVTGLLTAMAFFIYPMLG